MKKQTQKEEASADQAEVLIKKFCLDCKTRKTPMWRIGPSGPKSLCNACGIKFRKKSSEDLNVEKDPLKKEEKSRKNKRQDKSKNGSIEDGGKGKKSRHDMKVRLRGLGKEVVLLNRQRSSSIRKHRKMGEVEQAALLLMAFSCGSVCLKKRKNKYSEI